MANINSLTTNSSSNMSSLYGNRNVLSGLASGMDTESMIENSVSGYKTKIAQLEKEQTKYQWKQDAYRSITDKMYDLTQKYTSYTSKTNLYSNAFFTNSISTTAVGPTDAISKVSATGRSSSDIQILAAQAATAARYDVSVSSLGLNASNTVTSNITTNWADSVPAGTLKGTMTLNYDGQKIDISFDETDININGTGPDDKTLAQVIQEKLNDATINTKFGSQKAGDVIKVEMDGNGLKFSETEANKQGANPYISYMDSSLKSALGATDSELYAGSSNRKYTLSNANGTFTSSKTVAEYLADKDINVTVDGVTKSFRLNKDTITSSGIGTAFREALDSVGMRNVDVTTESDGQLKFGVGNATSQFSISAKDAKANELLGFGGGISNYLSEKTSIGTLLGANFPAAAPETVANPLTQEGTSNYYTDAKTGNRYEKVTENGADNYYRVNEKNERLYELKINDKSVYVSKESSLESVLDTISASDAGVSASYSKLTGKFVFTAKETGESSRIEFGNTLTQSLFGSTNPSLSALIPENSALPDKVNINFSYGSLNIKFATMSSDTDMKILQSQIRGMNGPSSYSITDPTTNAVLATFTNADIDRLTQGGSYVSGADATVRAMVNGEAVTLTRSSNTFDMDGMSVTLKGDIGDFSAYKGTDAAAIADADAANKANAVSFSTSAGSDDLIKTIREFVDEYNAVMKEVHDAYATQPAEKSAKNHTRYEPLSDDDKDGMSEKAIESYEAKAKQGLLFGDSDLRALYESMVKAISPGGNDGAALRDIGLETSYSGGLTQIKLNESKLRDALSSDPDKVRNAFTKSKEGGASTDGLMTSIKNTMERYASASYATPGILVKKAGSTHNATSLLNNDMQKQLDNVQTKIEQWQTKMGAKIDYYTRQFTALEKLMNTMNSQSSALAGLMGG